MNTTLPAAVAAADALAESTEQNRAAVSRALRALMRPTIGYETADLAADIGAAIACQDGTSKNEAIWWSMFDQLDKGSRSDLRLIIGAILLGRGGDAYVRATVLKWCEQIAMQKQDDEAARIRVDGSGSVYEIR